VVFSSVFFLFGYLPVVLALYLIVPGRTKKLALLFSSLFFYFWGENFLVWIVIASTTIDFFCALSISEGFNRREIRLLDKDRRPTVRQRAGLIVSITANLVFLGYFKYFNFFVDNVESWAEMAGLSSPFFDGFTHIALPLGISFYTFQSMSYTIDVYRGDVRATRNFLDFSSYVTMFPQLVAGPIVRYKDIETQLKAHRILSSEFAEGVKRFAIGLAKKVLVANSVALAADAAFAVPSSELTAAVSWVGILAYSLQIYFDFSGYSDMAIGLGLMLGFRFRENFDFPYISQSVKEFWRRWHISLSTWFRDYLYIPLGGGRGSTFSTYRNLVIVFLLCGFWHGAEWKFIVWGCYHGLFLVVERSGVFQSIYARVQRPWRHVYLLMTVMIGWVFFRADDLGHALSYLKSMALMNQGDSFAHPVASMVSGDILFALFVGIVFSAPVARYLRRHIIASIGEDSRVSLATFDLVQTAGLALLLMFSAMSLASGVHNPFLYFRF